MARFAQPIPAGNLQRAMTIRGLTPHQLAAESGLGTATVSRAMNGKPATVDTLNRIAEVLKKHEVKADVAELVTPEQKPALRLVEGGA